MGSISSLRSGYFTTKLMPVAEALRSHAAWSSKKASKSENTTSSQAGGVATRRSSMAGLLPAPGPTRKSGRKGGHGWLLRNAVAAEARHQTRHAARALAGACGVQEHARSV